MILKPLKMVNTMWHVPAARAGQLADAYEVRSAAGAAMESGRVNEDPSNRYLHGGAGLVTTAHDYFRFSQFVLNGGELDGVRLLSRKTVQYMLSDHMVGMGGSTASSTGPGYGFGLGIRGPAPGRICRGAGEHRRCDVGRAPEAPSFTIDPREKIVECSWRLGPSTRFHTRMLFKNMLYGALVE
jgi:CubicO group peptidase (beta-lactamase class C family)